MVFLWTDRDNRRGRCGRDRERDHDRDWDKRTGAEIDVYDRSRKDRGTDGKVQGGMKL